VPRWSRATGCILLVPPPTTM